MLVPAVSIRSYHNFPARKDTAIWTMDFSCTNPRNIHYCCKDSSFISPHPLKANPIIAAIFNYNAVSTYYYSIIYSGMLPSVLLQWLSSCVQGGSLPGLPDTLRTAGHQTSGTPVAALTLRRTLQIVSTTPLPLQCALSWIRKCFSSSNKSKACLQQETSTGKVWRARHSIGYMCTMHWCQLFLCWWESLSLPHFCICYTTKMHTNYQHFNCIINTHFWSNVPIDWQNIPLCHLARLWHLWPCSVRRCNPITKTSKTYYMHSNSLGPRPSHPLLKRKIEIRFRSGWEGLGPRLA